MKEIVVFQERNQKEVFVQKIKEPRVINYTLKERRSPNLLQLVYTNITLSVDSLSI